MPDDVLDRLRAGDEAAYREIVGAWSAGMRLLARSYVQSDATAEEVVQEAWCAVVRGLWAFEGRAALRTWVHRIVVNIARRRGAAERRAFAELTDRPPEPREHRPGPEDDVLGRELRRELEATLAVLPPRQRAVVALRDLEGLDRTTVRALLDMSEVAQRAHLCRGRRRLRHLVGTSDPGRGVPSARRSGPSTR